MRINYLDLERNAIKVDGAKAIAKALNVNTSLTAIGTDYQLDLYSNGICDKGAIAIAEALKVNRFLIEMSNED